MSIQPNYYNKNGFDVIDYIVSSQGKDAAIEFCRGNVIKYITRFDKKNGHEDLVKALTYIYRIVDIKYEKIIYFDKQNKIGIDVIDYIVLSQGKSAAIEFCRGIIINCISNFDKNNGYEDLVESCTFINRIMEIKYEKVTDSTKRNKNFVEPKNGIRLKDGYNLYKCSYKCECGNIGKRYIKEDADKTSCHKCNKELEVYTATVNDAHDDDFNYFLAY